MLLIPAIASARKAATDPSQPTDEVTCVVSANLRMPADIVMFSCTPSGKFRPRREHGQHVAVMASGSGAPSENKFVAIPRHTWKPAAPTAVDTRDREGRGPLPHRIDQPDSELRSFAAILDPGRHRPSVIQQLH